MMAERGEDLATIGTTFARLLKRNVRVVFEDPGDNEKKGKVWTGMLTKDDGTFIELTTENGKRSFIAKRYIIAISETW